MRRTSAGAVVALGLVAIGSGRLFGLVELYVIGTGLLLGVAAALMHVRIRPVHVTLERRTEPIHPIAGEDMTVTLTLRPVRRTPTCELTDPVGDEGRVGLVLAPLPRHRVTRVHYRVPTSRRGVLTLGPATLEVSDPLGLLGRRRTIGACTDVVVHPRWTMIDLPETRGCEGLLIDAIRKSLGRMAVDLEFRSVREYVAGDDLRRINWKASARRDVLTLNEFEARAPLVVHLFVDHDATTYTDDGFERAVSVAASFAGSAGFDRDDSEPRLHVSIPPALEASVDGSTRDDVMQCLAEIRPTTSGEPVRLNDPGEFRVNVIVCGDRDQTWLESIDRQMGTGHAAVVVQCESPSGAGGPDHWFSLPCPDFSTFATNWGVLCRRVVDR